MKPLTARLILVLFFPLGVIATQSCNKAPTGADAPYLGLWVQDLSMMRESADFKQFAKESTQDQVEYSLKTLKPQGMVFTEKEVFHKVGNAKPGRPVVIKSVATEGDGYRLTITTKGGQEETVTLKVDGEYLTLTPAAKPSERFRRCELSCLEKMDAGEQVLFDAP